MTSFSLFIKIPRPFSFRLTVRKPAGWHWGTPFEIFEEGVLYTAVRLPGFKLVGIKACESRGGVEVDVFSRTRLGKSDKENLAAMLELGLGCHDDLAGFYRLAETDPLIRKLKDDLFGLRLGFLVDVFERCLLAVTLQMAPMKRSTGMRQCLIEKYGEEVTVDGRKIPYWPSAAVISDANEDELKKECVLGYRAKAIHRIAEAVEQGFPSIVELSRMSEEEMYGYLTSLYGVGSYSAQIISPHRGFPLDVWSARIFYEIIFGTTPPEPRQAIRQLEEEAERRWGGYKQHVFVYVLNDLPNLLTHYPITKLS